MKIQRSISVDIEIYKEFRDIVQNYLKTNISGEIEHFMEEFIKIHKNKK